MKIYEIRLIPIDHYRNRFFGYINGREYTEDFLTKEALARKYPIFKSCINNNFSEFEVDLLEEVINEKIEQIKSLEQCQATKNDIEIFENILNKIK